MKIRLDIIKDKTQHDHTVSQTTQMLFLGFQLKLWPMILNFDDTDFFGQSSLVK